MVKFPPPKTTNKALYLLLTTNDLRSHQQTSIQYIPTTTKVPTTNKPTTKTKTTKDPTTKIFIHSQSSNNQ